MCYPISSWFKASILILALSASAVGAQEQTNTGAAKAAKTTKADKAAKTTEAQKNKPLPISKEARAALKQAAAVAAKGKGLKGAKKGSGGKVGQRGDQFVHLKVMLPKKPDKDFIRFMEEWSPDHPYTVRPKAKG